MEEKILAVNIMNYFDCSFSEANSMIAESVRCQELEDLKSIVSKGKKE